MPRCGASRKRMPIDGGQNGGCHNTILHIRQQATDVRACLCMHGHVMAWPCVQNKQLGIWLTNNNKLIHGAPEIPVSQFDSMRCVAIRLDSIRFDSIWFNWISFNIVLLVPHGSCHKPQAPRNRGKFLSLATCRTHQQAPDSNAARQ